MNEIPECYKHINSKGNAYFLHKTDVTLVGGKVKTVYFFKRAVDLFGTHTPCLMPEGHEVRENPRNGFCVVVRKRS